MQLLLAQLSCVGSISEDVIHLETRGFFRVIHGDSDFPQLGESAV